MRGKTVRQNPAKLETDETYVPRYFYGLHKFVTLTAGVIILNGVTFLVTLSQKIGLFTTKFLPSSTAAHLSCHLTKVLKLYVRVF